jgi:hypothetical protein
MVTSAPKGFAPALLGGLADLGPVEPFSGDLSLELGISLWLRMSGTSLLEARGTLLALRRTILQVCRLDPATEPLPMVGRSPRADVVNLVAYLSDLLRRASNADGGGIHAVVDRVIADLPEREDAAIGA